MHHASYRIQWLLNLVEDDDGDYAHDNAQVTQGYIAVMQKREGKYAEPPSRNDPGNDHRPQADHKQQTQYEIAQRVFAHKRRGFHRHDYRQPFRYVHQPALRIKKLAKAETDHAEAYAQADE
jgi:hypothetical protein